MPTSSRRRNGFTIVEVLIVTAILSLLAALLFPVFWSVRASVRRTHCSSNLRQLGTALQMYVSDHDGRYPFAADPSIHHLGGNIELLRGMEIIGPTLPMLPDVLSPYVRHKELWHCPADNGKVRIVPPHVPSPSSPSLYAEFGMSYYYGIAPAWSQNVAPLYNLGVPVLSPSSEVPIMWDAGWSWHGEEKPPGLQNFLFCDGHVKSYSPNGRGRIPAMNSVPD